MRGLHISHVDKRLLRRPNFSGGNYEAEANHLRLFVPGQIIPFVSWARKFVVQRIRTR